MTPIPNGTLAQLDAITAAAAGPVSRLVLAGIGHAPHLEARDAVVEAIAQFICSVNATPE